MNVEQDNRIVNDFVTSNQFEMFDKLTSVHSSGMKHVSTDHMFANYNLDLTQNKITKYILKQFSFVRSVANVLNLQDDLLYKFYSNKYGLSDELIKEKMEYDRKQITFIIQNIMDTLNARTVEIAIISRSSYDLVKAGLSSIQSDASIMAEQEQAKSQGFFSSLLGRRKKKGVKNEDKQEYR